LPSRSSVWTAGEQFSCGVIDVASSAFCMPHPVRQKTRASTLRVSVMVTFGDWAGTLKR
jgi:hypothetical protein